MMHFQTLQVKLDKSFEDLYDSLYNELSAALCDTRHPVWDIGMLPLGQTAERREKTMSEIHVGENESLESALKRFKRK